MKDLEGALKTSIRDVPDFPKKGIIFKDITTLLQDGKLFRKAVDGLSERYKDKQIDAVISVESRGFIFGSAIAYKLGCGLIPVRKKGKLPYKTYEVTYELEYGQDTLAIHQDALTPGQKVLIVDDLLATGGTTAAAIDLMKKMQGEVIEAVFLIELDFLKGRDKIKDCPVFSIVHF